MQVPDPKLKYQQLLLFAKKLPPLDKRFQTDENKVRGCVSQVISKQQEDSRRCFGLMT